MFHYRSLHLFNQSINQSLIGEYETIQKELAKRSAEIHVCIRDEINIAIDLQLWQRWYYINPCLI